VEHGVAWVETTVVDAWDFADPRLSRLRFAAVIDALPPGGAAALVFRTQIARTHSLSGEFDDAHAVLDAAEIRASDLEAGPARDHALARIAIERGRAFNAAGRPAEAAELFDSAYTLAGSAGAAGLAVDALHMSAIAAGTLDGDEAALRWNERAIAEAEGSDDPAARRWLASLLNNLGWSKHGLGLYEDALAAFERALALRAEAAKEPDLTIAKWAVARALRSVGRYEESLAIQDELAASPHGADDGYVHEERGECLLALDRPQEACPAFVRAYELLSADAGLAQSEPDRIARLRRLAGLEPSG
jgi:tetratricopeptide (TPR) repeat protein